MGDEINNANVVLYVRQEIKRRTAYKTRLETLRPDIPDDYFSEEQYSREKVMLEKAIEKITSDIFAIVKRHLREVEIDSNPEVSIANILAGIPKPEELKRFRVISSRLGAPG